MNLHEITPLVLTYNEAPNIGRCLAQLGWAREVVVVDSFSTDETLAIAGRFANVRVIQRVFDQHARQWNHGLEHGGIATAWVLALDADYMVGDDFVREVAALPSDSDASAYRAPCVYAAQGCRLRGSVYPPVTALFRRSMCEYVQDGHTQRLVVRRGKTLTLDVSLIHDDRKSLARWLQSQAGYMELEAAKVRSATRLSAVDRLRLYTPFAPMVVLLYSLLIKRGIFDGRAGWFYAFQRAVAEGILQLTLLEHRLSKSPAITAHDGLDTQTVSSGNRTA